MDSGTVLRAAQYLRMSTEHQQYSLDNQAAAIQQYAQNHGFAVVQTYADAGKSGLVLQHRDALKALLGDVVSGKSEFNVILVYDVSRWGRFQDTDEAAHYEFLCKSAGVPVHYCAETFANDGTLMSSVMKALKRTMAGEYSRELSVKVFDGKKRIIEHGFRQGGEAGYGLRRMIVSPDGKPKQVLASGEYKALRTDKVILVPGPPDEVALVREIFQMVVRDKSRPGAIARELNRRGIKYRGVHEWYYEPVEHLLRNQKYVGHSVWGRTAQKLRGKTVRLPIQQWIIKPNCFQGIIDQKTFDDAQAVLNDRTSTKSNEELLNGLKSLLAAKGKLSQDIIQASPDVPPYGTYKRRFGGMRQIYDLVGWHRDPKENYFPRVDKRRRTQRLRDELVSDIQKLFPDSVSVVRLANHWRPTLRLWKGPTVSVLLRRFLMTPWGRRWKVDFVKGERHLVTLLCRLNATNDGFQDFYVVPNIDRTSFFRLKPNDKWLARGTKLSGLAGFEGAARALHAERQPVQEQFRWENRPLGKYTRRQRP